MPWMLIHLDTVILGADAQFAMESRSISQQMKHNVPLLCLQHGRQKSSVSLRPSHSVQQSVEKNKNFSNWH